LDSEHLWFSNAKKTGGDGTLMMLNRECAPMGEGMEAEQKRKKPKRCFGTQPKKKASPGWMVQKPRAGTGDSVGRLRRYR